MTTERTFNVLLKSCKGPGAAGPMLTQTIGRGLASTVAIRPTRPARWAGRHSARLSENQLMFTKGPWERRLEGQQSYTLKTRRL